MKTVDELIKKIGRSNLEAIPGVLPTAVSRAKREGIMPATWREPVAALCAEAGIGVPKHLFRGIKARASTIEQHEAGAV